MNSTHIKEANVEQDVYYTGIAEKAYDKVVRFLSKHKNKLEGVDHVINEMRKPFNNDMKRKRTVRHFVNYYDTYGVVKLESFDSELAEWINSDAEE